MASLLNLRLGILVPVCFGTRFGCLFSSTRRGIKTDGFKLVSFVLNFQIKTKLAYLFLHILFAFFLPVHPTPPETICLPRPPSFWDLRTTVFRREKGTCKGWVLGRGLEGAAPQGKKGISFRNGARKKNTKNKPKPGLLARFFWYPFGFLQAELSQLRFLNFRRCPDLRRQEPYTRLTKHGTSLLW